MAEIEQNKSNLFAYDIYIQDTYTNLFGKGIEYTSVFEFQYEATSEATNEPVEEGGFASFYKTMQPEKITLVFGFNTDDYIQNQALTVIYERMKRYELITIATPQKMYRDMTIIGISYKRESSSGVTMLTISVDFQKVKQVSVTQEKGIVFQPRNADSANKTNTGRKQEIDKKVETKVDRSMIKSGVNWFRGY